MLKAALEYVRRGWWVFPLHGMVDGRCSCGIHDCPDAGKHPKLRNGLKGASRDEAKIREWFAEPANIGVVTGELSGITVLDIDVGEKGGDATWTELNKTDGEPVTLMAKTGSGGVHVFFKYNSALNTSGNTLGKGVDCRNDNGYIVAPPSKHRSGDVYEWMNDDALANLPKHLAKKREKRGRPRKDDPTRKRYSIEEVVEMLEFISAEDRDTWRHVGIILGREFSRSTPAWDAYVEWSNKWDGQKGRNHDGHMNEAFYEISQQEGELSLGSIVHWAIKGGWTPKGGSIPPDSFLYYAPGNKFIYRPTGEMWPSPSVDSSCAPVNVDGKIVKPTIWLKVNRLVTSMTNDPLVIEEVSKGYDCRGGVIVAAPGACLYNAYLQPTVNLGDPKLAKPWINHVKRVFDKEGDADQFFDYMAHRVQRPGEKARFALIIAGEQGVGKDTAISMCGAAIGYWNMANIEAKDLDGSFNEYASAVLIVVSEAANAQDMSKWAFNEKMKVIIAGTPDYMMVNQKYGEKFAVRLHNGTIITTNHMTSGLYIPPDDRRYDVIECATRVEMGLSSKNERSEYFAKLWRWFNHDKGEEHIAAWLHERDIKNFDAATGQRITAAHQKIVTSGFEGDEWLLEAIDTLGDSSDVIAVQSLWEVVEATGTELSKRKFQRQIPNVMPRLGYSKLNNPDSRDGRHRFNGKQGVVYFKVDSVTFNEALNRVRQEDFGKEVF